LPQYLADDVEDRATFMRNSLSFRTEEMSKRTLDGFFTTPSTKKIRFDQKTSPQPPPQTIVRL
jgi:hypothetical protein